MTEISLKNATSKVACTPALFIPAGPALFCERGDLD